MKTIANVGLKDVQAVYSGPEGELWELVMGQQIHLGGLQSSLELAEKAGIRPGTSGVDLCCCTGAGMRFLVRFRNVARMQGVDATEAMVRRGTLPLRSGRAGRADYARAGRRLRHRAARRRPPTSSGARTPGVTWSTRTG